jgi:hypothetical protein
VIEPEHHPAALGTIWTAVAPTPSSPDVRPELYRFSDHLGEVVEDGLCVVWDARGAVSCWLPRLMVAVRNGPCCLGSQR